jgi:hypothetical protein
MHFSPRGDSGNNPGEVIPFSGVQDRSQGTPIDADYVPAHAERRDFPIPRAHGAKNHRLPEPSEYTWGRPNPALVTPPPYPAAKKDF